MHKSINVSNPRDNIEDVVAFLEITGTTAGGVGITPLFTLTNSPAADDSPFGAAQQVPPATSTYPN